MTRDDALDTRGGTARVTKVGRGHWEPSTSVVGPVVREPGYGGDTGDYPGTPRDRPLESTWDCVNGEGKAAEKRTSNEGM